MMLTLPPLHAGAGDSLVAGWNLNPLLVGLLLIAGGGYYLALRQVQLNGRKAPPIWQVFCFYGGLLFVALALIGPLDTFNDEFFFMHMLQHLALMQAAAPLILLGRPVQLLLRAISPRRSGPVIKAVIRPKAVRLILTVISAPVVVTLLFNGNMIFWHIPNFYEAALRSDVIHEIEHMAFFSFALLFWWPIIDPVPRHHKMRPIWGIAAVFVSMVVGIGLGAILTLSDSVIYPYYLSTAKPWGISERVDQQLAGLIMWVGGGLIYLGILLGMLARLFGMGNEPEPTPAPAPAPGHTPSSPPSSATVRSP